VGALGGLVEPSEGKGEESAVDIPRFFYVVAPSYVS
jgi:hypothetical protein